MIGLARGAAGMRPVAYARERKQFGKPSASSGRPVRSGEDGSGVEAARLLVYNRDRDQTPGCRSLRRRDGEVL